MARDFAKAFYNSREWQITREYVLKRDNYVCVHCGAVAEEVHHIVYLSPKNIDDPSITMNANNLISLCKNCHFAEHRGQHGKGRMSSEDYPYEFDENGMLVKRKVGAGTPIS